jgi:hypothetical protein
LLWRSTYQTQITRDEAAPAIQGKTLDGEVVARLPDGVWLIVGGVEALGEWALWTRLLDTFPVPYITMLAVDRRAGVRSLFPPSQQSAVVLVAPTAGEPARVRAMVVHDGRAVVTMTGPPTEDAWDEFVAALA